MHKRAPEAVDPSACKRPAASSPPPSYPSSKAPPSCPSSKGPAVCPVSHGSTSAGISSSIPSVDAPAPQSQQGSGSLLSKLNPLNYMFYSLSQEPAPNQIHALPVERDESSIPKSTGDGNWEYPSPQQMYNALLRKGFTDTDVTAVESMVSIHNFLNEGAWAEIVEWERRFGKGLKRGWEVSKYGEENAAMALRRLEAKEGSEETAPTLIRLQGRPKDMTPKAAMIQVAGWLYPSKFEYVDWHWIYPWRKLTTFVGRSPHSIATIGMSRAPSMARRLRCGM